MVMNVLVMMHLVMSMIVLMLMTVFMVLARRFPAIRAPMGLTALGVMGSASAFTVEARLSVLTLNEANGLLALGLLQGFGYRAATIRTVMVVGLNGTAMLAGGALMRLGIGITAASRGKWALYHGSWFL